MEQYVNLFQSNPLFEGIEKISLLPLLQCLDAKKHVYPKGSLIFSAGESSTKLGIVLSGYIHTAYEDLFGERSIISSFGPGQLFCDAFSCTKNQQLPVSIISQTDCTVLLLDIKLILHTCTHACRQHHQVNENLIHILAEKYASLNRKVMHLSRRTTRRKLLSYLCEQSRQAGNGPILIPFNQQELADYLFIDRSGLSTELNRLKKQGILSSEGNFFSLRTISCPGGNTAFTLPAQ